MARFLCDENLSATVVAALRAADLDVVAWTEVGERGASDDAVMDQAKALSRVLVTRDLDFSDILAFPPGSHPGIVVCRFPNITPPATLGRELAGFLAGCDHELLHGSLAVLEPGGRVRFRVQ